MQYYIQAHEKNSWLALCRHITWDGWLFSNIRNLMIEEVSLKHRQLMIYWRQSLQRFKTLTFLANMQKAVNLANVKRSVPSVLILCILEVIWQKAVQSKIRSHQTSDKISHAQVQDNNSGGKPLVCYSGPQSSWQQQWRTATGMLQRATIILTTVEDNHRYATMGHNHLDNKSGGQPPVCYSGPQSSWQQKWRTTTGMLQRATIILTTTVEDNHRYAIVAHNHLADCPSHPLVLPAQKRLLLLRWYHQICLSSS